MTQKLLSKKFTVAESEEGVIFCSLKAAEKDGELLCKLILGNANNQSEFFSRFALQEDLEIDPSSKDDLNKVKAALQDCFRMLVNDVQDVMKMGEKYLRIKLAGEFNDEIFTSLMKSSMISLREAFGDKKGKHEEFYETLYNIITGGLDDTILEGKEGIDLYPLLNQAELLNAFRHEILSNPEFNLYPEAPKLDKLEKTFFKIENKLKKLKNEFISILDEVEDQPDFARETNYSDYDPDLDDGEGGIAERDEAYIEEILFPSLENYTDKTEMLLDLYNAVWWEGLQNIKNPEWFDKNLKEYGQKIEDLTEEVSMALDQLQNTAKEENIQIGRLMRHINMNKNEKPGITRLIDETNAILAQSNLFKEDLEKGLVRKRGK